MALVKTVCHWLSEVILQQTVEQGMPYYYTFTKAFPTVQRLAAAPQGC
jgi:A/G-specific adenine glycosylase